MAGGYLVSETEYQEDTTQITEPQQLSFDSPCGAALLLQEPAVVLDTVEPIQE